MIFVKRLVLTKNNKYGGIFLPATHKINYVNMLIDNVDKQHCNNHVSMQLYLCLHAT